MYLQSKVIKLISYYELKKNRYASEVGRLVSEEIVLKQKISELEFAENKLFEVLNSKKLVGQFTLSQLFEHKRTEAVIRRKIADIRLLSKDFGVKKTQILSELVQSQEKLKVFNYKQERYVMFNRNELKMFLSRKRLLEESNIEESLYGKNR